MIGEIVPVVMLPRFTSYLGEGTYTTVPLDVSEYAGAAIEFWRGKLRSPATGTFAAYFEEASEPWGSDGAWSTLDDFSTADASDLVEVEFSKKYFRIRIVLTDSTYHAVGITCWAAGSLQRRIPPVAGE